MHLGESVDAATAFGALESDDAAKGQVLMRLVDVAGGSQGRDSLGFQAVRELLRRGYPDALLVPPEALEAYRQATAPRRVPLRWILATLAVAASVVGTALGVDIEAPPIRTAHECGPETPTTWRLSPFHRVQSCRPRTDFICELQPPRPEPDPPRIRVRWGPPFEEPPEGGDTLAVKEGSR